MSSGTKSSVQIRIEDVLTPRSCAQVVVELIKYLLHQKLQIPYDFERLKFLVAAKGDDSFESAHSRKYFHTVSSVFGDLERLFKNIYAEFESDYVPEEVYILFGSNIICVKEAYRIIIPPSLSVHFHNNHNSNIQNVVRKILRTLLFTDEMMRIVDNPLSLTNMFILLKQPNKSTPTIDSPDHRTENYFFPTGLLTIPGRIPEIAIGLDYNANLINCCDNLKIFTDTPGKIGNGRFSGSGSSSESEERSSFSGKDCWFRSLVGIKGFKACNLNGQSLSNDWISKQKCLHSKNNVSC